uniref:ATP synthase F0 subunit 6 n=1 Tax=Laqueus japonicus TaxID=147651 RepID=UPI000EF29BE0|nr:ATP synthase F0 subunit 6 [Laqueus japonicus]AYI69523.1 ATP synthase F0 subunit 6 [Laqueus japonicus]
MEFLRIYCPTLQWGWRCGWGLFCLEFSTGFMGLLAMCFQGKGSRISGFSGVVGPLFFLVMSLNLMGLFPMVFGISTHLLPNFTVGLTVWLGLILSSIFYGFYSTVGHMLPSGAPWWLNPFLIMVDFVSLLIRPLTLTVRLAANMAVGHVVLGLWGMMMLPFSGFCFFGLCVPAVMYILFEIMVCMVQGYIFFLLVSLYAEDHSG